MALVTKRGSSEGRWHVAVSPAGGRLYATPLARRIARQHRINLATIRGSGPRGRIVAADLVLAPSPEDAPDAAPSQVGALTCALDFAPVSVALKEFSRVNLPIELEDALVRAAGGAVATAKGDVGQAVTVAVEMTQGLTFYRNAGATSLLALHDLRTDPAAGPTAATDAALSIKYIPARDLIPTLMPILPGLDMRLVIVGDGDAGTATLFFSAKIEAEIAALLLSSLKRFIEQPILMLL